MADPDYMDSIGLVATGLCTESKSLGSQIMAMWTQLESYAAEIKYDVLSPSLSERECLIRVKIRQLITLLYLIQGANVAADVAQLREKNALYGGSWCRRGGPGAFMMLARKADRLDEQMRCGVIMNGGVPADTEDTTGDLRRYLILVESWHVARSRERQMIVSAGQEVCQNDGTGICTQCGDVYLGIRQSCPGRGGKR